MQDCRVDNSRTRIPHRAILLLPDHSLYPRPAWLLLSSSITGVYSISLAPSIRSQYSLLLLAPSTTDQYLPTAVTCPLHLLCHQYYSPLLVSSLPPRPLPLTGFLSLSHYLFCLILPRFPSIQLTTSPLSLHTPLSLSVSSPSTALLLFVCVKEGRSVGWCCWRWLGGGRNL